MSDKALKNAMARRDALAASINKAQEAIGEWRRELARIDEFVKAWHDFAKGDDTDATDEIDIPPLMLSQTVQNDATPTNPVGEGINEFIRHPPLKGIRRRLTNSKKEDVAEGAREIISERGEPVMRSELFQTLLDRGFVIQGSDPEMVLSTMLWRMQDRVIRLKSGGYWLADVPLPEAGYVPAAPDTKSDQAGSSEYVSKMGKVAE